MLTEYLPSDYVDEVCPPMRLHPSNWIVIVDGVAHLAAWPEDDGEPEATDRPAQVLKVGDVVDFDRCEDLGGLTLTVRGTRGVLLGYEPIPSFPPRANIFRVDGDNDTVDDNLDDCIKAWVENEQLDGEQEIELDAVCWISESWVYASGDGLGARFERVVPS